MWRHFTIPPTTKRVSIRISQGCGHVFSEWRPFPDPILAANSLDRVFPTACAASAAIWAQKGGHLHFDRHCRHPGRNSTSTSACTNCPWFQPPTMAKRGRPRTWCQLGIGAGSAPAKGGRSAVSAHQTVLTVTTSATWAWRRLPSSAIERATDGRLRLHSSFDIETASTPFRALYRLARARRPAAARGPEVCWS